MRLIELRQSHAKPWLIRHVWDCFYPAYVAWMMSSACTPGHVHPYLLYLNRLDIALRKDNCTISCSAISPSVHRVHSLVFFSFCQVMSLSTLRKQIYILYHGALSTLSSSTIYLCPTVISFNFYLSTLVSAATNGKIGLSYATFPWAKNICMFFIFFLFFILKKL